MTKRRTFIAKQAPECGPTVERAEKGDYEAIPGKKERQKSYALSNLERAGEIDGEAVEYALKWLKDYEFSRNDYLDAAQTPLPEGALKGDVHTWAIARGWAGERISYVRDVLGLCAHSLLVLLIADSLSFSEIGRRLYPGETATGGRKKVVSRSAMVLTILPNAWRQAVKRQSERQGESHDDKSLDTGTSLRQEFTRIPELCS